MGEEKRLRKKLWVGISAVFLVFLSVLSCGGNKPADGGNSGNAPAAQGTQDASPEAPASPVSWFVYAAEDGEVTITELSIEWFSMPDAKKHQLSIPREIGGMPVTAIGREAFKYSHSIHSVHIPDTVVSIGTEAFANCSGLEKIILPAAISRIAPSTFYECTGLAEVIIPETVTEIGSSAFHNCFKLGAVEIPGSVKTIGSLAFANCKNLSSVTIPSSVESIGNRAFVSCPELWRVILKPAAPPGLGNYAFDGSREDRRILVPGGSLERYRTAAGWSRYAESMTAE